MHALPENFKSGQQLKEFKPAARKFKLKCKCWMTNKNKNINKYRYKYELKGKFEPFGELGGCHLGRRLAKLTQPFLKKQVNHETELTLDMLLMDYPLDDN